MNCPEPLWQASLRNEQLFQSASEQRLEHAFRSRQEHCGKMRTVPPQTLSYGLAGLKKYTGDGLGEWLESMAKYQGQTRISFSLSDGAAPNAISGSSITQRPWISRCSYLMLSAHAEIDLLGKNDNLTRKQSVTTRTSRLEEAPRPWEPISDTWRYQFHARG